MYECDFSTRGLNNKAYTTELRILTSMLGLDFKRINMLTKKFRQPSVHPAQSPTMFSD